MNTQLPIRKNKEPIPPLIKMSEVCQLLSISRITVRKLIDDGTLEGVDINSFKRKQRFHLRITRESLLKFYEEKIGEPLPSTFAFTSSTPNS